MSKAHPDKQIPEYARKIRELRKISGLTQRRFAGELRTTNVTIARWEGGTREPNLENYTALAAFAQNRASPLGLFFAQRILGRKAESREKGKQAQALRELEMEEYFAAGGDEESQRLLDCSHLDPVAYARQWNEDMEKARGGLDNGAFAAKLNEMTYEAAKVNALRTARSFKIKRTFELLGRQVQIENIQRKKIKEILGESKATIDQGKPVDLIGVVGKIVSMVTLRPRAAKRRAGREGMELGGINLKMVDQIFEQMVIAEAKRRPLEPGMVLRNLEHAFGLKTERAKVQERS
jgi:transcriptional regulator with XRE-family HTH domain